jgi:hypothetical protein
MLSNSTVLWARTTTSFSPPPKLRLPIASSTSAAAPARPPAMPLAVHLTATR